MYYFAIFKDVLIVTPYPKNPQVAATLRVDAEIDNAMLTKICFMSKTASMLSNGVTHTVGGGGTT